MHTQNKRRAGELFGAHTGRQRAFVRWALTAVVAILTELVCIFIIACTAQVQGVKFNSVLSLLSHVSYGTLPKPLPFPLTHAHSLTSSMVMVYCKSYHCLPGDGPDRVMMMPSAITETLVYDLWSFCPLYVLLFDFC